MTKPVMLMLGTPTERMAARLSEAFEVLRAAEDRDAVLDARGAEIEYVLSMYHGGVKAADMDRMPKLRAISNYGVGYDAIDTPAAVERGILVAHTPDVLNDEVANTAIMLLLACARNLIRDERYLREGRWEKEGNAPLSTSIRGKTVGIVGLGRIGLTIADKLSVFGTDIAYTARSEKGVPWTYHPELTELARASDYLIVITPGGPGTHHLIDRAAMDALGPEGCLINIARGTVVDEAALIEALQEGRLGQAGLDVFENEPHVPEALIALDNVVLLPHVGSATVETRQAMGDLAVDNLVQFHRTGKAIAPVPECRGT